MPCFEVNQPYPCCATRDIAIGAPGYRCSCTPDLPMMPAKVECGQYADSLAIGCRCSTTPLSTYGKMPVDKCSGHVDLYGKVTSCYATRTADDWTCTCPTSVNANVPPPGMPVSDCTPPADLNVRTCPEGTYATDNCDGNCHDEQCTGCSGQTCDSFGCQGNQLVCSANKCAHIPAGGKCGFSNLP
jgi:hypothetical protein